MSSSSAELCQFILGNLRHFVDGFDEDDAISSLLSQGGVVLRDLRIKETVLDILGLPVDVAGGCIGLLDISAQQQDTNEERILVTISHVHLLLKPLPPPWNIAREYGLRTHVAKLLRLQLSELFDAISLGQGILKHMHGDAISRSLFFDFARCLKFTVNDVHVRYENAEHEKAGDHAIGFTIDSFMCNDTKDSEGRSQPTSVVTKTIYLTNVCIYADTSEDLDQVLRWSSRLNKPFSIPLPPSNSFLLSPFSASITCTLSDTAPGPLLDLQFRLPQIQATLTNTQYKCIYDSAQVIQAWKRQWKYRQSRPSPEVFANNRAKAYLKYAFEATLHTIRERHRSWSWRHFKQRRDDRQLYTDLFLRRREAPLLQHEEEQFHALENKLSFSDLRLYRLVARRSMWAYNHPVSLDSSLDIISERLVEAKISQPLSSRALVDGIELVCLHVQVPQGSILLQVVSPTGRREILRAAFVALNFVLKQMLDGRLTTTVSLDHLSAHADDQALVFVKEPMSGESNPEPFLQLGFDTESGKMKIQVIRTEVIYDKELVDAMLTFFQIPPEQLQSAEAFLTLASQTIRANEKQV